MVICMRFCFVCRTTVVLAHELYKTGTYDFKWIPNQYEKPCLHWDSNAEPLNSYANILSIRTSCWGYMLCRQVQNEIRVGDFFMIDTFRVYSFLPLRMECDLMFYDYYCSPERVLRSLLFYKNSLYSPCIYTYIWIRTLHVSNYTQ